ncbi:putative serine/threonine protein kinase [Nitratiruptor sp. YY08-26]|uniref:hypothetical protein n=1 Tax=unclassified Nitratiruptor TaxID=2624044 RepID=UPI0019162C6B|nr:MULTISPECIES: hypothetical protein [unclassified Nitratiruptor]BCD62806.1 putative serine/threonine protein kinase [Nitratiruptor sp. YY08-13]BCD66742.1 putative serine/threonine protein kinase [Nitratiruptor sp. YY08-26]
MQKIFEGNRGEIFLIDYFGKKAVLKKHRFGKPNTIKHEAFILQKLQYLSVVPRLYEAGEAYVIMEYIDGISLKEALKRDKKAALKEALYASYLLDLAHINHRELGRYYHFIFTLNGVKIIDFERSQVTNKPRNVLQFIGFYLPALKTFAKLYQKNKKAGLQKLFEAIDVL